ncbi:Sortase (surface protein transpeptidase) [uncultured Clostridium sp.]|nr:Sortase (surface protein transpeptidase) [uncultured Clostridium sp.]
MADDIMGMCDKERRQHMQYGGRDSKTMKGKLLTGVGLLLIAAALLLTVYNIRESDRAGAESEEMVVRMESLTADLPERLETEKKELVPEYKKNPEMEMPTVEVNGQECVGMIEIPALGLKLPVISEWSDAKLKKAPCRYSGSAYLKNMIIAGHNYRTHFSGIKRLNPGDSVVFTDADGNVFSYEVTEIETVGGYDIEKMEDGDWDLTLFTCTNKGKARAAVRCREIEE